jgi:hypothetical protein
MTEHFTDTELACRCGCGLKNFHPGFLEELETLREVFGKPMNLNSACRCTSHNTAVGGHARSLHVGDAAMHAGQQGTLAVDVVATDGEYRGQLFAVAWDLGWSIGWNAKKGFLHLDKRVLIGLPHTTFDY